MSRLSKDNAVMFHNSLRASSLAWAATCIALVVVVVRFLYVSIYAIDTPFMDQWDGELERLLVPWVQGSLTWSDLFALHAGQHRILWHRLWVLLVTELNNGQWDNLVLAYANACLYTLMSLILILLAGRSSSERRTAVIVTGIYVLLAALLPMDFDNFTTGFQSQFYFLILFSALCVGMAAYGRPSYLTSFLCALAGVAAYFSMASGLLALGAALGVLIMRWIQARWSLAQMVFAAALLGGLCLGLLKSVPSPHQDYATHTAAQFLHALVHVLAWPTPWSVIGAIVIWSPVVLWSFLYLFRRQASSADLFFIGLAAWAFAQAMAIAAARGQPIDMTSVTSRYTEVIGIGLLANAWFAVRLASQRKGIWPTSWSGGPLLLPIVGVGSIVFILAGIVMATPAYWNGLQERQALGVIQTDNTRYYMDTLSPVALQQPFMHIPYISPDYLRDRLSDPVGTAILPLSIRTPARLTFTMSPSSVQVVFPEEQDKYDTDAPSIAIAPLGKETTSGKISTRYDYVAIRARTTQGHTALVELVSVSKPNKKSQLRFSTDGHWTVLFMRTPDTEFVLQTRTDTAGTLLFSQPFELGPLTTAAQRAQRWVRRSVASLSARPN